MEPDLCPVLLGPSKATVERNMQDPLLVRVASIRQETEDIKSFALVPENGYVLPAALAGSHIDVQIAPKLVRQYSLCNGPTESHAYHIAVKRETASSGGSHALHDTVREGTRLIISRPKHCFRLHRNASEHLLIAGGIGITPLFSMLKHLSSNGEAVVLHYFTRSPVATVFMASLMRSYTPLVTFYFGLTSSEVTSKLRQILAFPNQGKHAYICGPSALLDCALRITDANGWLKENVHHESFGVRRTQSDGDESFDVHLARSNRDITVSSGQTMLEAILEAGVSVDSSCEQGICGTCMVNVVAGELRHRDQYLTDAEKHSGQVILPCVSRGVGRVVLDL